MAAVYKEVACDFSFLTASTKRIYAILKFALKFVIIKVAQIETQMH